MAPADCTYHIDITREIREGWPLLIVETEANGDSKSTNERAPSLVGSLGSSSRPYTRFFSALAARVGHVQNIFFLTSAMSALDSGQGCDI
jgi:hypothetical protein